jgi:hypothetical protein
MTQEFKNIFNAEYDFVDFILATGLKAPKVSQAYNEFREFCYNETRECGMQVLSECFELWSKTNLID